MPKRLDAEQVRFFKEQGYLVYDNPLLPDGEFDALKRHFEAQLIDFQARSGKSPEHMDVPHFTDLALFRWLFNDSVLDLVEDLIGPDIGLWSSHFICKPAGNGKRVPWHEDSAYWGHAVRPMEVVTVWLAIDPSIPENGCMRVIPATHQDGYSPYDPVQNPEKHVFSTEIRRERRDESKAVDIVLKPNQCSIHHAKLMHGSNYNTSTQRRCGYTMRYFPTTACFEPECDAYKRRLHQIYLARGRDRAGNVFSDPSEINRKWVEASAEQRKAEKSLAH